MAIRNRLGSSSKGGLILFKIVVTVILLFFVLVSGKGLYTVWKGNQPAMVVTILTCGNMFFMAVGLGGLYFMWVGWKKIPALKRASDAARSDALSDRAATVVLTGSGGGSFSEREAARRQLEKSRSRITKSFGAIGLMISIGFILMGGAMAYFTVLRPFADHRETSRWVETPCTIESSEVRIKHSGKGTRYQVAVRFAYTLNGRAYRSDRYDVFESILNRYKASDRNDHPDAIVRRYPKGSRAVCYVNPQNPQEAVLSRKIPASAVWGLIPVLFFCAGVGLLVHELRNRSKLKSADAPRTGPVALKPAQSPYFGVFFGAGFMSIPAVIIVVLLFTEILPTWKTYQTFAIPLLLMVLFASLFLCIGSVIFVRSLMKLQSPRVHLAVTPLSVPLGGEMEVSWELSGRIERFRHLEIELVGREEADYPSRSKNRSVSTEEEVFYSAPIQKLRGPIRERSGAVRVVIPTNSMHTHKGGHNRIVWAIRVHGDIPKWPDMEELYEIEVLPMKSAFRSP